MRKVLLSIAFVFSFGMMNCGGSSPPEADAGFEDQPRYRDVCPARSDVADRVAVTPMPTDRRIAVAKQDPTDEDAYRLHAVAWRMNDGDVEEVSERPFDWILSDQENFSLTFWNGIHDTASVRALRDCFDAPSGDEPETTLTVCVENQCAHGPEAAHCEPCSDLVCGEPVTLVGIVNLEGHWRIGSGDRALNHEVLVRQSGREARTVFEEYAAAVEGDRVSFYYGDRRFEGTIAPTRDSVDGVVIETEDRGEDRVADAWGATRVGVDN